ASLSRIVDMLDNAIQCSPMAYSLDPLSALTHRQLAMLYVMAGRLDDADAAFQLAIELSPNAGLAHAFLAITRLMRGRAEEGLALAQAEQHDVFRNVAFAMIHHALGHPAESDKALQTLI